MVAQEIMCTNNVVIIWQCEIKYAVENNQLYNYNENHFKRGCILYLCSRCACVSGQVPDAIAASDWSVGHS